MAIFANWDNVVGFVPETTYGPWDKAFSDIGVGGGLTTGSDFQLLPIISDSIRMSQVKVSHDVAQRSPDPGPQTNVSGPVTGAMSMYLVPTIAETTVLAKWADWAIKQKEDNDSYPATWMPHQSWSMWSLGNDLLKKKVTGVVCLDTTINWTATTDASGFLTASHTCVAHTEDGAWTGGTDADFAPTETAAWTYLRSDPFMASEFSCFFVPTGGSLSNGYYTKDIQSVSIKISRGIDVASLQRGGAAALADPRSHHGLRSVTLNMGVQPGDEMKTKAEVLAFLQSDYPMTLKWTRKAANGDPLSSLAFRLGRVNFPEKLPDYVGREGMTAFSFDAEISATAHGYSDAITTFVDDLGAAGSEVVGGTYDIEA